jgi:Putative serine dehydratase domain
MGRPADDRAIVDAGLKALVFDSGPPLVCDEPAATYERAADEHGRLAVSAATSRLGPGDKIRPTPATSTRPSTSTIGMFASAATASNSFGGSPPGVRFIELHHSTAAATASGSRLLRPAPMNRTMIAATSNSMPDIMKASR